MIIPNEEIMEVVSEIPDGHRHVRTTVIMKGGQEFTFQEATIANLVRAFITVKTHPQKTRIRLKGGKLDSRKESYAEWQLIEEETA